MTRDQKRHLSDFFRAVDSAPDDVQRLIARSLEAAARGEREHRAMGARWLGRATKCRASVTDCARAFVARWYYLGVQDSPRTAADLLGVRDDALFSYIAAEHDHKVETSDEARASILAWDYCDETRD